MLHQKFLATAWIAAAELEGQKWPGALPIRGTEALNIFLGTALPCKPSIQLKAVGNHTASTNSLSKDVGLNWHCGTTNVSMETSQPLVKQDRNAVSFLLLSKLCMGFVGADTFCIIAEMEQPWLCSWCFWGERWHATPCVTPCRKTGNHSC